MTTKRSVKLIKRRERVPRRGKKVKLVVGPNKWSKSVREWVVESQERDRSESLPTFDSLFKDTPLQTERAD